MSICLERTLMQRFNITQNGFNVLQVPSEHCFTDTDTGRALGKKGFDFVTVPCHKVGLIRAKRFESVIRLGRSRHQQCFFTGALQVVWIAEYDHRTGFNIA
ncbi:hypothetical protein D3C85_892830 [compost metagenome]